MPDTLAIPQEARERIEQIGAADVVIGLVPATHDPEVIDAAITRMRDSPLAFSPAARVVLIHPPYSLNGGAASAHETAQWQLMAHPLLSQDPSMPAQSLADGFRAVYSISQRLAARACAVIASDPSTVTAEWVSGLLQPAMDEQIAEQYDLIAPCYTRHRFRGLINRSIIYPLFRALYGKQVRNPLGPDFGASRRLIDKIVPPAGASGLAGTRIHPVASVTAEAVATGMQICQSNLGLRIYATTDWGNLSGIFPQILGPLFADVERHASVWQRLRASQPVPEFGQPAYASNHDGAVDVSRLIESFQLGTRNLEEVWGLVLPPSTLVELRRMARSGVGNFRMPDELWARIVYDFALGHRLRTINRDHLLRAITPLYLGWVASYAIELENADPGAVERRLENLCLAYENAKSYFVSRWRWPDRFNP
jgi:hypothetical protein